MEVSWEDEYFRQVQLTNTILDDNLALREKSQKLQNEIEKLRDGLKSSITEHTVIIIE